LSGRTDDRLRSGDGGGERVDIVVVYKVDRLTRSLADFTRLVETFDAQALSIVSVTQQFDTANSIGGRCSTSSTCCCRLRSSTLIDAGTWAAVRDQFAGNANDRHAKLDAAEPILPRRPSGPFPTR
jgi:hypothetical protein